MRLGQRRRSRLALGHAKYERWHLATVEQPTELHRGSKRRCRTAGAIVAKVKIFEVLGQWTHRVLLRHWLVMRREFCDPNEIGTVHMATDGIRGGGNEYTMTAIMGRRRRIGGQVSFPGGWVPPMVRN